MHTRNDQQRLRRISRAQNQLFPTTASRQQPLFRRFPQHPACAVQTSPRQYNLGIQAHDEKRRRHWSSDPTKTSSERRTTRNGSSELLSNLLD